MRAIGVMLVLVLLSGLATGGEDLGKRYKATLDWEEGAPPRDWRCGPEDVFELKSFKFTLGDKLAIDLGPADVVFGHSDTNVVWAVVIPKEPGRVKSADTDQEAVKTIWMRFNPALTGKLFPKKTVKGDGDPGAVLEALGVCWHKVDGCWQAGSWPVIPYKKSIVFDLDTPEGKRRMFIVDTEKGTAKYEHFFASKPVPPPPASEKISKRDALAAFDAVWNTFDEEYPMFVIRPDVDWKKLRSLYRPLAAKAETAYDAAGAISLLLRHLRDLHVYVKVGDTYVTGFTRRRTINANWKACQALLGKVFDTGEGVTWGRTDDGIGYLAVDSLSREGTTAAFDAALEKLADTWGLVVDLRWNGGGDELMARKMAGRLLDKKRVYSLNQYRSGPRHKQLGEKLERTFEPRGPWRYESPVVVLFGQKTMSSAESFALMFAQCPQVTTMGDRTAGSSANPRRLELPGGIVVNMPRWLDQDPDGKPIDEVGVAPDVKVEVKEADFRNADPVLSAGLEKLRETKEKERKPGKR